MFPVETLLNLVIYVRNMHNKNTEAPFPIYIITTIVSNGTRIQTIRIVLLCLFSLICFGFLSFQTAHRNKNKQIEAEAGKKLRTTSLR